MCQSKINVPFNVMRTFGVELEGYCNTDIRDDRHGKWEFKEDGSLSDESDRCHHCDGDGYNHESCSDCDGTGQVSCDYCEEGSNDCEDCDGSGCYTDEDGIDCECENCEGKGYVYCEECSHGEVECSECSGEGYTVENCEDCGGEGYVREGNYGTECVSDILTMENGKEALDELFDYINDYGWETNDDCGTHIHVGANDLTGYDMAKLTLLTHTLEPVIYGMNDGRYNNSFCKKIRNSTIEELLDMENIEELNKYRFLNFWDEASDRNRYFGLNFQSYNRHETVEFRYFMGSDDKKEVMAWSELVVKLVELSKHTTLQQVFSIISEIESVGDFNDKVDLMKELLEIDYKFDYKDSDSYRDCLRYKCKISNVVVSDENIAI